MATARVVTSKLMQWSLGRLKNRKGHKMELCCHSKISLDSKCATVKMKEIVRLLMALGHLSSEGLFKTALAK